MDWIGFGGPVLKSGDMTDVLSAMAEEGLPVTRELAAHTSPYMRDHLRRFGQYSLNMEDLPPALHPRPLPIFSDGSK